MPIAHHQTTPRTRKAWISFQHQPSKPPAVGSRTRAATYNMCLPCTCSPSSGSSPTCHYLLVHNLRKTTAGLPHWHRHWACEAFCAVGPVGSRLPSAAGIWRGHGAGFMNISSVFNTSSTLIPFSKNTTKKESICVFTDPFNGLATVCVRAGPALTERQWTHNGTGCSGHKCVFGKAVDTHRPSPSCWEGRKGQTAGKAMKEAVGRLLRSAQPSV